jgi:4'-phosphopantetheinyl transferase
LPGSAGPQLTLPRALPVRHWAGGNFANEAAPSLLLVAVDTPKTSIREAARQQVRAILREILAAHWGCLPAAIAFESTPGQPLRLHSHPEIGLSISHEVGLSLLAINFAGPVGIDLLQAAENSDWVAEIDRLATDYLGCSFSGHSDQQRQINFARAWTAQEAKLKRLGWGLGEFDPVRQTRLDACHCCALELPPGFIGAVAC